MTERERETHTHTQGEIKRGREGERALGRDDKKAWEESRGAKEIQEGHFRQEEIT